MESPSKSSEKDLTVLNDLPEFCLDRILTFLNLNDLIQIIQTKNCFLTASAVRVFVLNYKNVEIEVIAKSKYPKVCYRNVFWPKNICDEMTFSLILDQFGSILTKLNVSIEVESMSRRMIEICSSKLSELTIALGSGDVKLEHKFENLRKLTLSISGPNVDDSWTNINCNFPKLQSLEIENKSRERFKFCEALIHQKMTLKHFGLYNISFSPMETTQLALISRFINGSKHLTSLTLDGYSRNLDTIQRSIEWKSMQIEHLSISTLGLLPNLVNVQQLKNLRSLKMAGLYDVELEPFHIPNLEELNVDAKCQNESFLNFLMKFKYLKHLTIGSCSPLTLKNIDRLGHHFDQLENVKFCMRWKRFDICKSIVLDGIPRLMNQRPDLRSVNVCLEYDYYPATTDHRHWIQFKQNENENWRTVIDYKDKGDQLSYLLNISFQNQSLSI